MDRKRIDTLRSLLKSFALAQKNCLSKVLTDVDIAITAIDSITSNDWVQFSVNSGLTPATPRPLTESFSGSTANTPTPPPPSKTAAESTQPQPTSFSSRSVVKIGQLELGLTLRWKSYVFILTKYGFLHYFTSTQVSICF